MFKVKKTGTDEIITVYAARREQRGILDYTEFLIYQNGEWIWVNSRGYEPCED